MGAQYLLRFDDCCPTMNWSVWRQVEEILVQLEVKPILAVVPDNQDATLKVASPSADFWSEVRGWQARGWTIGLHGYQHLYATRDAGLVGINEFSEFSGLSYAEQRSKLRRALDIFEQERVAPGVWVAPAHSFDGTTLEALSDLGILCVSDGFSLHPHLDTRGIMWVPQQLWRFRRMPFGLWTVCFHLNQWTAAEVARFRSDLDRFAERLTDWPSVVATYQNRKRTATDAVVSRSYRIAVRGRRWIRQLNAARSVPLC